MKPSSSRPRSRSSVKPAGKNLAIPPIGPLETIGRLALFVGQNFSVSSLFWMKDINRTALKGSLGTGVNVLWMGFGSKPGKGTQPKYFLLEILNPKPGALCEVDLSRAGFRDHASPVKVYCCEGDVRIRVKNARPARIPSGGTNIPQWVPDPADKNGLSPYAFAFKSGRAVLKVSRGHSNFHPNGGDAEANPPHPKSPS